MGQAKQQLLHQRENDELVEFLQALSTRGELIGAVEGITKQIVGKGIESLSYSQKKAIDDYVDGYKRKHECSVCQNGNVSSLSDYIEIADEGMCSMCQYDHEKFMKE
jgi:hypothetical protein